MMVLNFEYTWNIYQYRRPGAPVNPRTELPPPAGTGGGAMSSEPGLADSDVQTWE